MAQQKTDRDLLADQTEIVRRKNREIVELRRELNRRADYWPSGA